MHIGDRFNLPEEGIQGVVTEIFYGDDMQPASAVIEMTTGQWAAVDLSMIEMVSVH